MDIVPRASDNNSYKFITFNFLVNREHFLQVLFFHKPRSDKQAYARSGPTLTIMDRCHSNWVFFYFTYISGIPLVPKIMDFTHIITLEAHLSQQG